MSQNRYESIIGGMILVGTFGLAGTLALNSSTAKTTKIPSQEEILKQEYTLKQQEIKEMDEENLRREMLASVKASTRMNREIEQGLQKSRWSKDSEKLQREKGRLTEAMTKRTEEKTKILRQEYFSNASGKNSTAKPNLIKIFNNIGEISERESETPKSREPTEPEYKLQEDSTQTDYSPRTDYSNSALGIPSRFSLFQNNNETEERRYSNSRDLQSRLTGKPGLKQRLGLSDKVALISNPSPLTSRPNSMRTAGTESIKSKVISEVLNASPETLASWENLITPEVIDDLYAGTIPQSLRDAASASGFSTEEITEGEALFQNLLTKYK